MIMLLATGKTKEQSEAFVNKLMEKSKDPMVKKGLIKNINDSKGKMFWFRKIF